MLHGFKGITVSLAPFIVSVSLTGAAGVVQTYDSYGSWLVACDNTLQCVTKGFSDSEAGAEIDIEREAGPNGTLLMSISADTSFGLDEIMIDDVPAGLTGPIWTIDDTDGLTTVSSDNLSAVRQLIRKLRNASKVKLGEDVAVPLNGLVAALVRLDERQGRVGSLMALEKGGGKPASQVTAPPPLPRIPHRPVTAHLAKGEAQRLISAILANQATVFRQEQCDADLTAVPPQAHALNEQRALVIAPCIAGAYQTSSIGFIVSRVDSRAARLFLPTPYGGNTSGQSDTGNLTNEIFDPTIGTLFSASKGRGLADCGMSGSWIWDGENFVLAQMSLQQACGGISAGDWPTVFRSIQD